MRLIFYIPEQAGIILISASSTLIGALIYFFRKESLAERRALIACLILMVISAFFWALYVQMYSSWMLLADRNMEKQFLGFSIQPEFTQFFNPFFVIMLSPLLSGFWVWLSRRRSNPSTPMKFFLGILYSAFAFLFLSGASLFFARDGLFSCWVLAGAYFLLSLGELLISPVGLAMVTRLAPPRWVGMMMGVWFLAQSSGFVLGGLLATLADVPKHVMAQQSLPIYSHAFGVFGMLAMGLAVGSLLLVPVLNKLIGNRG